MNVPGFVQEIIKRKLAVSIPNKQYEFRMFQWDYERWEYREDVAMEFLRQMQLKFPNKTVTFKMESDGPGVFCFGVNIRDRD